ncbi:BCCT family transporter [Georgenia sp. MJ173]|uniref:BCCT family transporter n=1 Tax=Georgenia sunbinii TaxID=3117728 RepID=UPI002F26292B
MSEDGSDAAEVARVPPQVPRGAHGLASVDRPTFLISAAIIVVLALVGVLFTDRLTELATSALTWVTTTFGWLFILAVAAFVLFALVLAFGRYGSIPLSEEGERPQYSTISWVAMMFSAGMGIGLVFFGLYEPVSHFMAPPPFTDDAAGSADAARNAMAYTFFHWGIHPWAIYSVAGLAIAYSTHRMGRSSLLSSCFEAFFRNRRTPKAVKAVDVLAIIATQFGTATTLGFGALQIAAGVGLLATGQLSEDSGPGLSLVVILVLTSGAALSAASGVAKGIRYLSNINMALAGAVLLFVFVVGPTVFILDMVPSGVGSYLSQLVSMSLQSAAFGGTEWLASWTIFYWAWWISWAPYVGTFIAKISRGRTIREFVIGALFTPTAVGVVWFTVFGGTGIDLQRNGVDIAGTGSEEAAFFVALGELPLSTVATVAAVILIGIFFITSADSGGVVLGTLSTKGSEQPWKPIVVFWVFLSGAVAAVLLLMGGLDALQTFTILAASPFVIVMILLCVALYVDLRHDPLRYRAPIPVRGGARAPAEVPFSDAADHSAETNGDGEDGQSP